MEKTWEKGLGDHRSARNAHDSCKQFMICLDKIFFKFRIKILSVIDRLDSVLTIRIGAEMPFYVSRVVLQTNKILDTRHIIPS
jgi:hypothetical protein